MSCVLSVVLMVPSWDVHRLGAEISKPVSQWPGEQDNHGPHDGDQWLVMVDDGEQGGGYKHSCIAVYTAGFNYVSSNTVLKYLSSLPWENPHDVVVYLEMSDYGGETPIYRMDEVPASE